MDKTVRITLSYLKLSGMSIYSDLRLTSTKTQSKLSDVGQMQLSATLLTVAESLDNTVWFL